MGADAIILDITKRVSITLLCYECGKEIDMQHPEHHENCCVEPLTLKVNIHCENLTMR